jgi:hypothetical protein
MAFASKDGLHCSPVRSAEADPNAVVNIVSYPNGQGDENAGQKTFWNTGDKALPG